MPPPTTKRRKLTDEERERIETCQRLSGIAATLRVVAAQLLDLAGPIESMLKQLEPPE